MLYPYQLCRPAQGSSSVVHRRRQARSHLLGVGSRVRAPARVPVACTKNPNTHSRSHAALH